MSDSPPTEVQRPSDDDEAVSATGSGDTAYAVLSMSERLLDGDDTDYLCWHALDHMPEQYRIIGLRGAQRWVSTPECRSARAVSAEDFDSVDHIVNYLFAEPIEPAIEAFFELGATLRAAGRMPAKWFGTEAGPVRRSQIGLYELAAKKASRRALVGATVLPWRPARGVYLVIERVAAGAERPELLAEIIETPGVAGFWRYRGSGRRWGERFADRTDLSATVFYLDEEPTKVAGTLAAGLAHRWEGGAIVPLLAAPFEIVIPWQWERSLP